MKLRRIIITLLLAAASLPLLGQRKVSADVQIKSVAGGKVATVTKSVYCTGNGRLVTYFRSPRAYYMVTNTKGRGGWRRPDASTTLDLELTDTNKRPARARTA